VAWHKHFIKLDDHLSSDDDDDGEKDESPPRDHEPIYHSPTPQRPTPSSPPHTRQKRFLLLLLLLDIIPLPLSHPREKRILLPLLLFRVPQHDPNNCHLDVHKAKAKHKSTVSLVESVIC